MKKFEQLDRLLEYLSAEELLEEVIRALDNDTAKDVLEHIATMHELPVPTNERK